MIKSDCRPQSIGGKDQQPRLRNQSSCSSDCSFIEFDHGEGDNHDDDDDEAEEDDDDEDDSEDDEDYDDSDWDDLGEGAGRCVDLADFDDLVGRQIIAKGNVDYLLAKGGIHTLGYIVKYFFQSIYVTYTLFLIIFFSEVVFSLSSPLKKSQSQEATRP